MDTYTIKLIGCDDTTDFEMQLTPEEVDVLERVSLASDYASSSVCQPTLTIRKVNRS